MSADIVRRHRRRTCFRNDLSFALGHWRIVPDNETTGKPTDNGWPPALRDAILALMRRQHGLDLACYEDRFLASALARRCRALRVDTPAAYLERLARDLTEARTLHRSLRIVYSEFFRDPLTFALLEQSILPALVGEKERRRPAEIRIWTAGCAAGQETGSVAILKERPARRQAFTGISIWFCAATCYPTTV